MSHTTHHTTHHTGRSLVRRVTTKLATLTATLAVVMAGVLALTLAPAGAATAQDEEPECFRLITVTASFADLGVSAGVEGDGACVRLSFTFD